MPPPGGSREQGLGGGNLIRAEEGAGGTSALGRVCVCVSAAEILVGNKHV